MIEINTTHNAIVTLLRQMDALPVKDFGAARALTQTHSKVLDAWGYDLTDTDTLATLEANEHIVIELSRPIATHVNQVIAQVLDSGFLNGLGARLLMSLHDEVEARVSETEDPPEN